MNSTGRPQGPRIVAAVIQDPYFQDCRSRGGKSGGSQEEASQKLTELKSIEIYIVGQHDHWIYQN